MKYISTTVFLMLKWLIIRVPWLMHYYTTWYHTVLQRYFNNKYGISVGIHLENPGEKTFLTDYNMNRILYYMCYIMWVYRSKYISFSVNWRIILQTIIKYTGYGIIQPRRIYMCLNWSYLYVYLVYNQIQFRMLATV